MIRKAEEERKAEPKREEKVLSFYLFAPGLNNPMDPITQ
jgi:hypothetical protein